ncbi:MAG: restriction endonuclease subunit S, partial [Saprospiraceae bacterium]
MLLLQYFKELTLLPKNAAKLKGLILDLAVRGKLTQEWRAEHPDTPSAQNLLDQIKAEKKHLIAEKKIKKQKPLPPIEAEEIPFEVPETWVWCRMNDICPNISSGSTPQKSLFREEGIPYLKVYNIRNQKINFEYRKQFIDIELHKTKLKRSILKSGDVVMNIVGPPLGKIAIIPDNYPEWNCNQAITFFKPIIKEFNVWIYTFLSAKSFLKNIDLIGTAGQDNISVTKSKKIEIPIPPLPEQKA